MSYVFKRLEGPDVQVHTFQVFKDWNVVPGDFTSLGIKYFFGEHFTGSIAATEPTFSAYTARSIFHSVVSTYYKSFDINPYYSFALGNAYEQRDHEYFVDVISIPQKIFGERIKPGSVRIYGEHTEFGTFDFRDDGYGNLVAVDRNGTIPSSTLISGSAFTASNGTVGELEDSKALHILFDQMYKISPNAFSPFYYPIKHYSQYPVNVFGNSITSIIDPSFYGYGAYLAQYNVDSDGNGLYGHVIINDRIQETGYSQMRLLNPRVDEDFAISIWVQFSNSGISQSIIDKQHRDRKIVYEKQSGRQHEIIQPHGNEYNQIITPKFPYQLTVLPTGKYQFSRSDGAVTARLTSSFAGDSNAITNVVIQRSASLLQLYIDGVLEGSMTDPCRSDVHNNADVMLGGDGVNVWPFMYGKIYSYTHYNRGLSNNDVNIIYGNYRNSNRVGNVIYDHGQIIASRTQFKTVFNPESCSLYNVSFESTKTIKELEVCCTVTDADCNVTQNPSARNHSADWFGSLQAFVTHSNFRPFITTVGVYNDQGQLLMVGKPAQPIPKIPGLDMTFVLKTHI